MGDMGRLVGLTVADRNLKRKALNNPKEK